VLAVTLLSATEWEVGLLNAAQTAAFLVVGLPAGAWIDRMLKRRVMIVADLVRFFMLALIPILWFNGMLEIWHLIVIGTIVGVATVFFDVAYQSYLPILLPGVQVGDANSKLETTGQIARIGGPGLAGGLLTIISAPVLIIADAVSYFVSAVFIWRIRDEEKPSDPALRQPLVKEIGEGLGFVFRHPLLRRIVGTTAGANFFSMLTMTLEAIFILRILDLGPAALGVIMAFGAVGGLLGAVVTPWISKIIGEGTALSVSAIAFGAAIFAFPLAAMLPGAALPILIVGAFLEAFFVLVYNILQGSSAHSRPPSSSCSLR
jgi:MFS family permease